MKILHIYDGDGKVSPEASVSSVVYYLTRELAKLNNEVTILERRTSNDPFTEIRDNIRYVRVEGRKLAQLPYKEVKKTFTGIFRLILDRKILSIKFHNILKRKEFDIIHFHFPFTANILINLNRNLRRKAVYTAHIGEEKIRLALDHSTPVILKVFSPDLYLIKRVRKTVILNKFLKNILVKKGIPSERLEIIPNGVDVKEFSLDKDYVTYVRRKYGLKGITVMFAGTVTPRKGVLHLIKAMENLKNEDVTLLVVGSLKVDEEYSKNIMDYAKRKNVNVKFAGFVPRKELKALYLASDIFVLPSLGEGSSIVLMEALASGKPLIGSNVGGNPMQIRDGWNGFLVEPGNEKQLTEKIKYLAENEKERKRMGEKSRKLAEEEFSWSMIAKKYLRVYEEIVD